MSLPTAVIQEEFHCKGGDPNKGTVCGAILMAWIVFMGMTANVRFPCSAQ